MNFFNEIIKAHFNFYTIKRVNQQKHSFRKIYLMYTYS